MLLLYRHREAQRSPQCRVKIMKTFKAVSIVLSNDEMDTHFCSSLTATIEGASGRFFLSSDKSGIKKAIDFAKTLDSEITVTEFDCEIEDGNFFFDNGIAVNV